MSAISNWQSVEDIDSIIRSKFYDEYFFQRVYPLKDNYKWQYRIEQSKSNAICQVQVGQVTVHGGLIPFELKKGNESKSAAWFVDFMTNKNFRRQGLGSMLARQIVKNNEITLALTGNEKSMGAFNKLGWIEAKNSYFHYFPIYAFNHNKFKNLPGFVKKSGNILSKIIVKFRLQFDVKPNLKCLQDPWSDNSFGKRLELQNCNENYWIPKRDEDYWTWRIKKSPARSSYFYIEINSSIFVLKTVLSNNSKVLDILYIPEFLEIAEKIDAIASIYHWSLYKGYCNMRIYTSNEEYSTILRKNFFCWVTHPSFAYSGNNIINNCDFQMIDNDFEEL